MAQYGYNADQFVIIWYFMNDEILFSSGQFWNSLELRWVDILNSTSI